MELSAAGVPAAESIESNSAERRHLSSGVFFLSLESRISTMTRIFLHGCLLLCSVLMIGCGGGDIPKTVPVAGTVTLDGKPIEGATVNFISDEGSVTSSGKTDASGKFSLQAIIGSQTAPGTVVGSHGVAVVKTESSGQEVTDPKAMMAQMTTNPAITSQFKQKYVIPEKYNNPLQSKLKFQVTEAGPNDFKIELTSK